MLNTQEEAPSSLVNMLYTPKLKANIWSLKCLDEQGCKILLER